MTPRAKVAFEIYRDLGPGRSLDKLAELSTSSRGVVAVWSSKYEWVRLVTEHDHAGLRAALGKREMDKEHATQIVVNAQGSLIARALEIANDQRVLPKLDRQGAHMRGPAGPNGEPGELMYQPVTRQSTCLEAIKWLTGLVGHVPVKRTEIVNKTDEDIDDLAAEFKSVHPDDLDSFMDDIRKRREADAHQADTTSDED